MFEFFLRGVEARRKVELSVMRPKGPKPDSGAAAGGAAAGDKRKRKE
jgi:hypothetical protein